MLKLGVHGRSVVGAQSNVVNSVAFASTLPQEH